MSVPASAPVEVQISLFATLASYLPPQTVGGRATLRLPTGATVAEALRGLGVPDDMPRVVLVNGVDGAPEQRLRAGDVVCAFPPLAGGAVSRL